MPSPLPRTDRAAWILVVLAMAVAAHRARGGDPVDGPGAGCQPDRTLNSHCPFTPPESRVAWDTRAARLREQVAVSLGLWPMPDLAPLRPRIDGRRRLDGYTIEQVTFESLPGLFVTGNLYRPDPPRDGPTPAVLCPHGHFAEGRFHDLAPDAIQTQLESGAERFASAARSPMQAHCVQLARMGCVAFHWDMLGYADSTQFTRERSHRFAGQDPARDVTADGWLLYSARAESHAQSVMMLQTVAVLRSVDFVAGLPDVDPRRIAITGASGGGTQSFIGAALDPRIAVAFPAVMVGTGMQGGCTCENACGLRVGTGNVEIAGLIAPRPLGMTAADDWTRTMPEDGFPELQRLYRMLGAPDRVGLFPDLRFRHNFNHGSRAAMYAWMNRHLALGLAEPVEERDFEWQPPESLTVWTERQPRPEGGEDFERRLLARCREGVEQRIRAPLAAGRHDDYLNLVRTGWRAVLGLTAVGIEPATAEEAGAGAWNLASPSEGRWAVRDVAAADDAAPAGGVAILVTDVDGSPRRRCVVVACGMSLADDGTLASIAEQPLVESTRPSAAYTFGYNLPLAARRARQVAATLAWLHERFPDATLCVEARGAASGVAAAAVFCLDADGQNLEHRVRLRLAPAGFRFEEVASIRDPAFLPGAARYLDLPGLVSCLPHETTVHGDDAAAFSGFAETIASQGGRLIVVTDD